MDIIHFNRLKLVRFWFQLVVWIKTSSNWLNFSSNWLVMVQFFSIWFNFCRFLVLFQPKFSSSYLDKIDKSFFNFQSCPNFGWIWLESTIQSIHSIEIEHFWLFLPILSNYLEFQVVVTQFLVKLASIQLIFHSFLRLFRPIFFNLRFKLVEFSKLP